MFVSGTTFRSCSRSYSSRGGSVTCDFFAYARCTALLLWPKVLDHIVIRKPKYTSLRTLAVSIRSRSRLPEITGPALRCSFPEISDGILPRHSRSEEHTSELQSLTNIV